MHKCGRCRLGSSWCEWLRCVGAATLLLAAATAQAEEQRPGLAVLPINAAGLPTDTAQLVQELLANELDSHDIYKVISTGDINLLVGFERVKDMVGCDEGRAPRPPGRFRLPVYGHGPTMG